MKVEGEHTFKATQEQVWDLFRDTEVMAAALPGTKRMDKVGVNEFEAIMHVRVGPVAGEFSGDLVISNENFPESYTMTVEGKGKPGFMKDRLSSVTVNSRRSSAFVVMPNSSSSRETNSSIFMVIQPQ